jgi:hypothetical protein
MQDSMRQQSKIDGPHRGVCYLTAVAGPGDDVSDLRVEITMTFDLESGQRTETVAQGVDAACLELRSWMSEMCRRRTDGVPWR